MPMKNRLLSVIFCIIGTAVAICSHKVYGQEIISSAGDFHSSGTHSVSWTLGEPVIDTWSGSGTVLTQGFQQPILVSVSIYENPDLNYAINAFPNPTSDFLNLEISGSNFVSTWYYLFDVTGKLLDSRQIVSEHTEIMFSHLPVATYYVKIVENSKELKTFKIVKQ